MSARRTDPPDGRRAGEAGATRPRGAAPRSGDDRTAGRRAAAARTPAPRPQARATSSPPDAQRSRSERDVTIPPVSRAGQAQRAARRAPSGHGTDRVATGARPPAPVRRPAGPAHPHRRQTIVLSLVLVLLVTFVARLVYVQGLDTGALAAEAYDKRLLTVELPAERGRILDADGVVLATSVERYDLVANQRQVALWKDGVDAVVEAAALLSPLVGVGAPELGAQLLGDDPYVVVARDLAPDVYRQVMELGIAGLSGERSSERIYPAGTTAGNVLGFVGRDGYGLAGLEQVYDDVLAGVPGSETYEQGARGQRIPTGADDVVPAVQGRDVQLTIVRDLQYVVQDLADQAKATHGAEWVTIEVVDVRTGAILALADSGAIDPNSPADANPSRAAAVVYEPGSTAKVIAMAAVLDHGLATPTTPYVVPDRYAVANGESFKDSHPHEPLNLTLTGILSESSNTGTVMVGQDLPRQVRYDYLAKFGLGSRTGVGLPGESAGLLHAADDWDGRSQYAVLFGQAVSVTTLQASQVFATLANGGVRAAPHLVAAVQDESGVMVPVTLTEPTRVVAEETADTVVRMLESAVAEGTGGNAAVPGYRIAGKTGTAEAFEGGGVIKTVASFVGIAPADDPRIVVNVALYDPKTSIYGGAVAAPVFSEVTGHALQHLGVPPSGVAADLFPSTWQ